MLATFWLFFLIAGDGLFSDIMNEIKELTEHGLRLSFRIFFLELEEKLGGNCFMKVNMLA